MACSGLNAYQVGHEHASNTHVVFLIDVSKKCMEAMLDHRHQLPFYKLACLDLSSPPRYVYKHALHAFLCWLLVTRQLRIGLFF